MQMCRAVAAKKQKIRPNLGQEIKKCQYSGNKDKGKLKKTGFTSQGFKDFLIKRGLLSPQKLC